MNNLHLLPLLPHPIWKLISSYVDNPFYVSLGSDCNVATALKACNLRRMAFPWDWNLTLGRIYPAFASQFSEWTIMRSKLYTSDRPSNRYGVSFMHDQDIEHPDETKHTRRCSRLQSLLLSPVTLHFVRQSHKRHHEGGNPATSFCMDRPDITDINYHEIEDMRSLDVYLTKSAFSHRITLFLVCDKCFSTTQGEGEQEEIGGSLRVVNLVKRYRITHETSNERINELVQNEIAKLRS